MINTPEMKRTIKQEAREIKELRKAFKQLQRTNQSTWREQSQLEGKTVAYRHLHIAYSMVKGKSYEQIEKKVKEGNEPSWEAIAHWTEKFTLKETA